MNVGEDGEWQVKESVIFIMKLKVLEWKPESERDRI